MISKQDSGRARDTSQAYNIQPSPSPLDHTDSPLPTRHSGLARSLVYYLLEGARLGTLTTQTLHPTARPLGIDSCQHSWGDQYFWLWNYLVIQAQRHELAPMIGHLTRKADGWKVQRDGTFLSFPRAWPFRSGLKHICRVMQGKLNDK